MSDNDRRARHPLRAALAAHAAAAKAATLAPAAAPNAAREPPPRAMQETAAEAATPAPRSVAAPSDSSEVAKLPVRAPFASVDEDPPEPIAGAAITQSEWVAEVSLPSQAGEGPPAVVELEPVAAEQEAAATLTATEAPAPDQASGVRSAADIAAAMADEPPRARLRRAAVRDDRP